MNLQSEEIEKAFEQMRQGGHSMDTNEVIRKVLSTIMGVEDVMWFVIRDGVVYAQNFTEDLGFLETSLRMLELRTGSVKNLHEARNILDSK